MARSDRRERRRRRRARSSGRSRSRDAAERPFSEVGRYSATLGDFVTRNPDEFERFIYLGWLLPLLALAGVGCLCFRNTISSSRRLALVLGLGTLVPCLLALG